MITRNKALINSILVLTLTTSMIVAPVNVEATTIESTNEVVQVTESEEKEVQKVELIKGNSEWKYEDSNTDLYSSKFFAKVFDTSSWKTGVAPLGYPATDNNPTFGAISSGTLVNFQKKPDAIITYYFKKNFTVENLKDITKLEATVGIDDGFVIYINGEEVNRTYINDGEVTHSTNANLVNEPSDPEGTVILDLTSALSKLVEGNNEISVSVHNRDANSSDIYFDMNLVATVGQEEVTPEESEEVKKNSTPKQVNVHMGVDPSTQVNFTYTTVNEGLETKVVLNKVGDSNKVEVTGDSSIGSGNKDFHKIAVSDLEPNTEYEYTVGTGEYTYNGTFKTALAKGSKESFKFAYLADTQVANESDAKALGATLNEVNNIEGLDFVYLAGDITNTATSESQWELLFNNSGLFSDGGENMFANNLISVVQGNHDNNILNRHINAPGEAGQIVYSYDYGPATFVMLNLEEARYSSTAREEQKEYLTKVVNEAKERGQWTFVGFHKSMYTGASHITDGDIIEARKYWAPVFTELDVDVVMQGHDHVYSRGFVDETGYKAEVTTNADGSVVDPENVPLYMVGGHAGGLKWYSKKNYTVGEGDILAPGYSFLDVNSTDTGSDVNKEQVIVEMEVSENEFTLNTYMFKYDTTTDTITTEKYLYDTLTVTRGDSNTVSAEIEGSDFGVVEKSQEVEYVVSLDGLKDTNAFDIGLQYDSNVMELVSAESLLDNTIFTNSKDKDGVASLILGTSSLLTTTEKTNVAKFKFKIKEDTTLENTEIKLVKANTAEAIIENDKITGAVDKVPTINNDSVITELYSYKKASDINGDGKITLADISIALANFKSTEKKYDIDLNGLVGTEDYILISSYIK